MVMHAKSGLGRPNGDVEVMGIMQGYPLGTTLYVMDAFGLPVEGTETRVNAGAEADEYMIAHTEACESVSRPENVVGWYHSHPGYGCWLSGIDVMTQQTYQMVQDPAIAIVVDPKRTMSAGKVEIGAFRCYTNEYAEKKLKEGKKNAGGGDAGMSAEKIDEFGLHAHKYYQVDINFFKSGLDADLLDRVWNEYWVHTLSTSPLLSNQDMICKTVVNVVEKIRKLPMATGYGKRSKIINEEDFSPIQ